MSAQSSRLHFCLDVWADINRLDYIRVWGLGFRDS